MYIFSCLEEKKWIWIEIFIFHLKGLLQKGHRLWFWHILPIFANATDFFAKCWSVFILLLEGYISQHNSHSKWPVQKNLRKLKICTMCNTQILSSCPKWGGLEPLFPYFGKKNDIQGEGGLLPYIINWLGWSS